MTIFVFFLGALLASIFLAKLDSHRRNREWDFDKKIAATRRGMQVEPFTGRTR